MANLILICDDNNQNNHSAVVSFFSVQPKMPLFCLILAVDPPPPRHEHPLFPIGDCETFYITVSIIAQSARFETRDLKALQKQ